MKAKEKKMIIILGGLIILVLAYFFGFQRMMESKDQIDAQNDQLLMRYEDLSAKAAKAQEYESKCTEMEETMNEILEDYPSYLKIENSIMDIYKLENKTNSYVSSLTIEDPVAVDVSVGTSTDGQTAPADGQAAQPADGQAAQPANGQATPADVTQPADGQATPADVTQPADGQAANGQTAQPAGSSGLGYQLYDVSAAITFDTKYNGLKQLLKLVVKSADKKKVDSLMATFDNTSGKITGTMVMDSYFLYGLDKPYKEADIPDMQHGTDNIFKSVE